MKNFTTADLEAVVRGDHVPPDVFQAILSDRRAFEELTRLLQVRSLLEPAAPEPAAIPATDVTIAEMARYRQGRLADPARVAAVERFFREHFPEALLDPHGEAGTTIEFAEDTTFEFGREAETETGERTNETESDES